MTHVFNTKTREYRVLTDSCQEIAVFTPTEVGLNLMLSDGWICVSYGKADGRGSELVFERDMTWQSNH